MHQILEKLFQKRGITDTTKLDEEEKKTFDTWNRVLTKEDLSLKDIKAFCETQIGTIEQKWKDLNLENSKKAELIPYHTVYKTISLVIDSPKQAREALEAQLNHLLNE